MDKIKIENDFINTALAGKYRVIIGYHNDLGCEVEKTLRHCTPDTADLLQSINTKYYDYFRVELDD